MTWSWRIGLAAIVFWGTAYLPSTANATASPIVIYTEHFPPYSYVDKSGKITGAMTILVKQVMDATGFSYEIRIEPWTRAIRNARTESNSLIYSLARTPARSEEFDWLVPLTWEEFYLIGYKSDTRPVTDAAISAGLFSAVCMQDDISCTLLQDVGFPHTGIIQFSSLGGTGNAASLMMSGRADFYPGTRHRYRNVLQSIDVDADIVELKKFLGNIYLFLAAGKQVPERVRAKIYETYKEMQKQGTYAPTDPAMLHQAK